MPKVSVIMPCFNHARFLSDSIGSVLEQTAPDLELIITDDCSSDGSDEIIRKFALQDSRIRPIRHEYNQGLSRSRNDGLRIARGQFIAFCDSDDIWERNKLAVQLELLREREDFGLTYCDTTVVDESGRPTGQLFSGRFPLPGTPSGWMFGALVTRNFINIQSVLVRKDCAERAGYFDEQIELVQDWWYWIRLSRHCRFLYSPQPLARYRVHPQSTNLVQKRDYCVNRVRVFRRILRQCADLPVHVKADILLRMGVDLCSTGKIRIGRQLLWNALGLSLTDRRNFWTFWRALRRLVYCPASLR